MANINLRDIRKSYGAAEVIHGISLDVEDGEFVALVGPSGCGKSTLLRMLAGLEEITSGDIEIGGRKVNALSPRERNIAMVFQSYALYPHMSVRQNMSFNLRLSRRPKAEIETRIAEAARMLGLEELLDRKPANLSGGQRQRVAMGRAVVRDPAAFLFDEPLSNLDAKLRVQMRAEIKALHRKMGTTSVYVTHDQIEAMTLADRIVVLNGGRIEQVGRPLDLYREPANMFVAGFIGSPAMTFFDARLDTREGRKVGVLETGETVSLSAPPKAGEDGRDVVLGIRPEDLVLGEGPLRGTVQLVEVTGAQALLTFECTAARQPVVALVDADSNPDIGADVSACAPTDRIHIFDRRTGDRL